MGVVLTVKSRFRRSVSFVTLSVAGALISVPAAAGDAVISTAQTTTAATSRADGTSPGNLTISQSGSISVGSGPAVTVDSSHTFTNDGTVEVTAESQAMGVLVATQDAAGVARNITGNVIDNGTINIPGPAQSSTLWPAYVNNTGIEVSGAGAFNGSIIRGAGSALTVGGNGGTGIAILSQMNGNLQNDGSIRLGRQESFGIRTTGAISGSLSNGGLIEMKGQEAVGIYAGGNVGGAIINNGTITTGAAAAGETPAVRGGHALWVAGNAGGIFLDGNGLTKEQEAAGVPDGATPDSSLSVIGPVAALYVGQGGAAGNRDITISALSGNPGASILVRGNVTTEAVLKTTLAQAVNITGTTVGNTNYQTMLTGAFRNEGGDIVAIGKDTNAQAIRIGEYAAVPSLFNGGLIHARGDDTGANGTTGASGSGGGDATAIIIEASGHLPELINTGHINAESHGVTQSAYTIIDYSGTLSSITNTGTLIASRRGVGRAVSFDLSRNTTGVTFNNSGTATGEMILGSGADTFTSTGGILLGNLTLGGGNDNVSISNTDMISLIDLGEGAHTVSFTDSKFEGGILLGAGGSANLEVSGSTFTVPTTASINVTNVRFSGASTLNFNINATDETVGAIKAAGNVVLENGTIINTTITGAVVDQFTVNLIEAQSLALNTDLGALQPGSTVMYQRQLRLAEDNANILQYQITRRTASELGLSTTQGNVYDNWIEALDGDTELAGTMASFTDQAIFENALAQLVPDTSDASRRVALNGRTLSQGAINRRVTGFLRNRNAPLGRFRSGWWLQQLTNFGSGDGDGSVPGYSTMSIGVAGGVDFEAFEGSLLGFSMSQTFGSAEEDARDTGKVKLSTTSIDFYGRTNFDDIGYISAILGYGFNSYSQRRGVNIENVGRATSGKSPGYQWGGRLDLGHQYASGNGTILTGYLRGSYFNTYQHSYEEGGGGPAVDLRYASRSYTSIRGGGGAMVEHAIPLSPSSSLGLNLRVDYAHEFDDSPTAVAARFVAGGNTFTLQGLSPASNTMTGGAGIAWQRRTSTLSIDYDAEKAGGYLGHTVALTWRARF